MYDTADQLSLQYDEHKATFCEHLADKFQIC